MLGAGLHPGSPNNDDNSGRAADPQEDDTNCLNFNLSPNPDDWDRYALVAKCLAERFFNPLRRTDPRSRHWQVKLWAWAEDRIPAPVVRIYKPFSGFVRQAQGPPQAEDNENWHGLPGDFVITGEQLETYVGADAMICSGEDWLMTPR